MYKIEASCRSVLDQPKKGALIKILKKHDWQYKNRGKVMRLWKEAPNPGSLHECRGMLHRDLIKIGVIAVFGMVYYDKGASN